MGRQVGTKGAPSALVPCGLLVLLLVAFAAAATPAAADQKMKVTSANPYYDLLQAEQRSTVALASPKPVMRRSVVLGLRFRGEPNRFAGRVSDPSSARYRKFLSPAEYRKRFSATSANQRRVRGYLSRQRGVFSVKLNPSRTAALSVMTPKAAKRIFCAGNGPLPVTGLCRPRPLRRAVLQVSVGEEFQQTNGPRSQAAPSVAASGGTPEGCANAISNGAFTPNQITTAYGVDPLHSRGLDGSGIRVATLSSQKVETTGFSTWAECFGLPTPKVRQFAMAGASKDTATAPEETVLDIEALATLAPGLEQITPIFVPLDQGFSNSFLLFMFGALDPSRQGGRLPDVLSISDGVCEDRFTRAELRLGNRMLAEASAVGMTALAASGDLGFQGCFTSARGALFPGSSRFTTSVGGTDLSLTEGNSIADEIVWSTYATEPSEGVGSGGGPSQTWPRPGYQQGPGIGPALQNGKPTRLSPDIAAMASFVPGLSVFDKDGGGWGVGGGTSAATPLNAAIISLVLQQEQAAGRPALGSLPPLLYSIARGPGYGAAFNDITAGTSSKEPASPAGMSPAGGAAQPGYDLATGLGSLRAAAFAEALAAR